MSHDVKATPRRPEPRLDELDTAPFWEATQSQALRYQRCRNCGMVQWYPRRHCTGCVDGDLEWRTAPGTGTIYTFSIVRQSYHPFFRSHAPYAVAWIDLDGEDDDVGPRLLSQIVEIDDPEKLRIGDQVKLRFEAGEAVQFPLFQPV